MSHLITNENILFMPGKLVDSELALWYAVHQRRLLKNIFKSPGCFGDSKGWKAHCQQGNWNK